MGASWVWRPAINGKNAATGGQTRPHQSDHHCLIDQSFLQVEIISTELSLAG
jgi:hypothetical protein